MTAPPPPPVITPADAIAAAETALQRPQGGLCAISARTLRLLVEAARAGEGAPQ